MKKRQRVGTIQPSERQVIVRDVQQLVKTHRISLVPAGDDMLWCVVKLQDSLECLQEVARLWGRPILVSLDDDEGIYLFNLLEGRIRDRNN